MNLAEIGPPASSTGAVLACLHDLLETPSPQPIADVLENLAEAFAVHGAGLSMQPAGPGHGAATQPLITESFWNTIPLDSYPWDHNPEVVAQVCRAREPQDLSDADGNSWLAAAVQVSTRSGMLWLACHGPRFWTSQEKASLTLAANCLTQALMPAPLSNDGAAWQDTVRLQESIDKAAAVTRRLAHDFCNILQSMLGFAELTLLQLPADAPARHYVEEVVDAARLGAGWSQKLQMFTLQSQARFVPTDIAAVLAEESANPHWRGQASLKIDLPARLPSVAMEKESLRLVLTALLDNAREAIVGKGGVTVSAQVADLPAGACLELLGNPSAGRHVELTISDAGVGLAPEVRARLFREIFFSTKGRRRGLGLAVVYGILRSCHAEFRLLPNADRGTTAWVYLPIARD